MLLTAFCDAAHRQDMAAFFQERSAQREALQPGLTRFLSRQ